MSTIIGFIIAFIVAFIIAQGLLYLMERLSERKIRYYVVFYSYIAGLKERNGFRNGNGVYTYRTNEFLNYIEVIKGLSETLEEVGELNPTITGLSVREISKKEYLYHKSKKI
jgi:hypothetical protein